MNRQRQLPPVASADEALRCGVLIVAQQQARGRGERLWETIQGRLPQELRVAGIDTVAAAQRYLDEEFVERINRVVQVPAAVPESAFVPLVGVDLDRVFCSRDERCVDNDNTIKYQRKRFQIPKNRLRATYAGCRVTLEELPNGRLSIWYGQHLLGRYSADGTLVEAPPTAVVERRAEVAA